MLVGVISDDCPENTCATESCLPVMFQNYHPCLRCLKTDSSFAVTAGELCFLFFSYLKREFMMAKGWMFFSAGDERQSHPPESKTGTFCLKICCRLHPAARFVFCSDPFYVTVMEILTVRNLVFAF